MQDFFLNCYINREFLAVREKKIENVEWYFFNPRFPRKFDFKSFLEQLNFN